MHGRSSLSLSSRMVFRDGHFTARHPFLLPQAPRIGMNPGPAPILPLLHAQYIKESLAKNFTKKKIFLQKDGGKKLR